MLPEIAAEALHFLTRRDLDKTCGISKWLDAMIAQCCDVYPLRRVVRIALLPGWFRRRPTVLIEEKRDGQTDRSFGILDEAAHFAGSVLRNTYVENFQLGSRLYVMLLFPDQWTTLVDAIHSGAVQRLYIYGVDVRALGDDALLSAVYASVVPSSFVTDDLLRSNVAKGLQSLRVYDNVNDAPHRLSDDAVLDLLFPTDATPGGQSCHYRLEGSGIGDIFLARFFERLRSSPSRPSGVLTFCGAPKQRGLSAYSHLLTQCGLYNAYHFPSLDNDGEPYEVTLSEHGTHTFIEFSCSGHSD